MSVRSSLWLREWAQFGSKFVVTNNCITKVTCYVQYIDRLSVSWCLQETGYFEFFNNRCNVILGSIMLDLTIRGCMKWSYLRIRVWKTVTLPPHKSSTLHNTTLINGLLAHPPSSHTLHNSELHVTVKTLSVTKVLCTPYQYSGINKSSTHPPHKSALSNVILNLTQNSLTCFAIFFYKGYAKRNVKMFSSKWKVMLVCTSKYWEFHDNFFRWRPEINL